MEGESMRFQFETWFTNAKVDLVLAGHVHAYERTVSLVDASFCISNKRLLLSRIKPTRPRVGISQSFWPE